MDERKSIRKYGSAEQRAAIAAMKPTVPDLPITRLDTEPVSVPKKTRRSSAGFYSIVTGHVVPGAYSIVMDQNAKKK